MKKLFLPILLMGLCLQNSLVSGIKEEAYYPSASEEVQHGQPSYLGPRDNLYSVSSTVIPAEPLVMPSAPPALADVQVVNEEKDDISFVEFVKVAVPHAKNKIVSSANSTANSVSNTTQRFCKYITKKDCVIGGLIYGGCSVALLYSLSKMSYFTIVINSAIACGTLGSCYGLYKYKGKIWNKIAGN